MQDGILRNEKGQLLPGQTANPEGANGHQKGWMRYGKRLRDWIEKPVAEISGLINDKEKFDKLSSIDAICVQHVAGMLWGNDTASQREKGLNRIEGKPDVQKEEDFFSLF